jgi:hypothetical protein
MTSPGCKVCSHPKKAEIHARMTAGEPFRVLAEAFSIPRSTLFDCKKRGHLGEEQLTAAGTARGALLARELENERRLQRNAEAQERKGDYRGAMMSRRELSKIHERTEKLAAAVEAGGRVNILGSPAWQDLQRRILEALAPFPEARTAVVAALTTGQEGVADA